MQNEQHSRPLTIGLTLLSALGRLVPHAPNVTPLGGSCLFAGSRVAGLWAYLLPLAVMVATDPLVGGYSLSSPLIYAAFMVNVWIGRRMVRQVTPMRVGAAAFICSAQFFLLTNLGYWVEGVVRHYPGITADFSGLMTAYVQALPFWGRTLAGDLLYSAAIFGLYELVARRMAHDKAAVAA
jgi:hypothetical protein